MSIRFFALLTVYLALQTTASCQQLDSLAIQNDPELAAFDSLLHSSDSLSILGLIDSLLLMERIPSQWALRLGYNSNVSAASRSLNINKFGLSPGISYFHRSGAYADVSAYWSQEYDPSVYLWIASAGYMRSITQYWTILGEYAHYFYSYSDTSPIRYYDPATMSYISYTPNTPYTNNLQVSNFLDAGKFTFRLDYSLLFGQQTVHRLAPSAGLNLSWKKVLGLDRIAIFPTVSLMYGSEVLPEKTEVTVEPITTRPLEIIFRYRNGLPLFTRQFTFTPERTVWGVMNYAINVPLSLSLRKWTVLVGYTYNFPQILPGEDLALSHGGFLSFNITRYLEFRRSR